MAGAARIEQTLGLAWMSDAADPGRPGAPDEPLRLLLGKAKAGDLAAFEQLIVAHERRVFQTALRLLRNVEDAQDAAQEVFLRLHKHLGRYDEERGFQGWLYRIVLNVCRDLNQRRGKHLAVPLEDAVTPMAGSESAGGAKSPFEIASLEQQRRLIADSLSELSGKERAALVLRDLEGLSTAEVAAILGSSEATVRSQISTARLKIKKFRDRRLRRTK
ncbi:MAG: RNA polymerase sigma factor [Bryobacterales bacterium]